MSEFENVPSLTLEPELSEVVEPVQEEKTVPAVAEPVLTPEEQRIVTAEEASLMASAVSSRALGIPVPDAMKGALRARMMKSMLMTIAARNRT